MPVEQESVTTRRRLLQQGAVGAAAAGLAWTAPSIITTSQASAGPGSCPCSPLAVNLLAAPFGNLTTVTSGGPYAANGSSLTFTRSSGDTITNTTCASEDWITGRITDCQAGAISSGQIPLVRTGIATPQSVSLTIDFSPAVSQLAFTLTDIDSSTHEQVQYQEQVTVSWTNATGSAIPTYTVGSGLTQVSADTYRATSTTFNAPSDDPSCNLGVAFDCAGTISSLTILSNDLNPTQGSSSSAGRMVGLAQLEFCAT